MCYIGGMATTEQDTPETPATKETKAATRTYVVLAQGDAEGEWVEIGSIEAATDQAAITGMANPNEAGTWVAIPERSFNPRTRSFDTPPPRPVWS